MIVAITKRLRNRVRVGGTTLFIAICAAVCLLPTAAAAQQIEQAVEALTTQILDSLQAEGKTTIAIVEMTDLSGNVTLLGRLVAEELTSQLFSKAGTRLKLVERSKLDEVLGEQRLGVRGLLEKASVETFGRALGVEAILTGTIAPFEDRVRINTRLIAVPSAELFATASTYLSRLGMSEDYLRPERSGAEGSAGTGTGVSLETPPGEQVQEGSGIRFLLNRCAVSAGVATCDLTLLSAERDCAVVLYVRSSRGSRLIDEGGNEYAAERAQASQKVSRAGKLMLSLVAGIPSKAQMTFEGVSSSAQRAAVLEIVGDLGSFKGGFRVQFRNVPLAGR